MNKKTKIFTLLFSGILFAYILFQSYQRDNLLKIFYFLFLSIISIYIFYNGIFEEIKTKKNRSLKSYPLTLIGIFLILLNTGITGYYEIKLNRPTLIKAKNHGIYADFKKNGCYIIKSGSWASKKYFYGKYKIKDSIITIDKLDSENMRISNKLVIMHHNKSKLKLFQTHKKENEILVNQSFEIMEDNRKQ